MKMQELNNVNLKPTTLELDTETCEHQIVYFGVTNVSIDKRTIGSVDMWRCGKCKKRFCEEKQLGIEELADKVGMPKIERNEKWGVLVCKLQKGKDKWKLVRLSETGEIKHECLGEKIISLPSNKFKVEDDHHWSFLVDDNISKTVEI